eukprot:scaffold3555_cov113-Isochrysis_galbana.AAC.5
MALSALLEAGGRVFEASEPLAARVAANRGRSHTPSPRAEAGVPVGADGWHRRANHCGWRLARGGVVVVRVGDDHGGAAGGGGAPFRKNKILSRTCYTLAAAQRITDCPLPSGHSPTPFPFVPHPFSLCRPPFAGGWFHSCVHYNSLKQPRISP